jgi:hypothetical protein
MILTKKVILLLLSHTIGQDLTVKMLEFYLQGILAPTTFLRSRGVGGKEEEELYHGATTQILIPVVLNL